MPCCTSIATVYLWEFRCVMLNNKNRNRLFFYATAVISPAAWFATEFMPPETTLLLRILTAAGLFLAGTQLVFFAIYFNRLR